MRRDRLALSRAPIASLSQVERETTGMDEEEAPGRRAIRAGPAAAFVKSSCDGRTVPVHATRHSGRRAAPHERATPIALPGALERLGLAARLMVR